MHSNIFIVEDDPMVWRVLEKALTAHGYSVRHTASGAQALDMIRQLKPDAVILDLGLPDLSGYDVFRILKHTPSTRHIPLVILTGLDKQDQEAEMLLDGADDYLAKPCDIPVLMARVQNVLRRREQRSSIVERLQAGPLSLAPGNRVAVCEGGDPTRFSPKEFDILYLLAREHPNVVTRNSISQKVWGEPPESIHPRAIDVHIRHIRLKLGPASRANIDAISGQGYLLRFC